jgi:plastocyanin
MLIHFSTPPGVRLAVSAVIAAAILVACGGDGAPRASAPTAAPSPASAERPAGGSASGAALSSAASYPAVSTPPAVPAEPVSAITIVATDNAYSPADVRIRAGEEVEVTVENRGQAIHDWRIRGVTNDGGKDTGTRLLRTGEQQTIAITLAQPGEYTLYCEVHPVEMRGRLIAE